MREAISIAGREFSVREVEAERLFLRTDFDESEHQAIVDYDNHEIILAGLLRPYDRTRALRRAVKQITQEYGVCGLS